MIKNQDQYCPSSSLASLGGGRVGSAILPLPSRTTANFLMSKYRDFCDLFMSFCAAFCTSFWPTIKYVGWPGPSSLVLLAPISQRRAPLLNGSAVFCHRKRQAAAAAAAPADSPPRLQDSQLEAARAVRTSPGDAHRRPIPSEPRLRVERSLQRRFLNPATFGTFGHCCYCCGAYCCRKAPKATIGTFAYNCDAYCCRKAPKAFAYRICCSHVLLLGVRSP